MRDVDRVAVQRFVDWLTSLPGRNGRLCDRSVANALTPLCAALDAAVAEGLLQQNPADAVVLQRFGTSAETTPLMEMRRSARRYRASCGLSRAGVPWARAETNAVTEAPAKAPANSTLAMAVAASAVEPRTACGARVVKSPAGRCWLAQLA